MSIKLQTAVLQCCSAAVHLVSGWWPLVQLVRAISGKLGCRVLVTNDAKGKILECWGDWGEL